ncbi:MAG: glycosyltransferase family 4 protein [Alphaproteobacteria bacterium]
MDLYFIVAGICFAIALAGTWAGTWLVLRHLQRRQILDLPNERSSHTRPTPRGGGIAAVIVLAIMIGGILQMAEVPLLPSAIVIGGLVALALVSWLDDVQGLSPLPRFTAQVVVVALATHFWFAPGAAAVAGAFSIPAWPLLILIAIAWLWFINLFNFMDGIDGLAGVEAASIGFAVFAMGAVTGHGFGFGIMGAAIFGAALGFLRFNWHPARIFMGDVGSVPLGFLLGWLLLTLCVNPAPSGIAAFAVIVPLYFLADASITIARRILRGEKFWRPHREHFYQKALASGRSHARVSGIVALTNVLLIVLALAALLIEPWPALVAAIVLTATVLALFARSRPP